ncbi:MAG: hypothetical protein ACRDVE_06040 [Actinocrinis sp.]
MDEPREPGCPFGAGLSFVGAACPDDFRLRTLTLLPLDAVDFRSADWADALVVVERGELEVECSSGARARFEAGSVLTFTGLPLARLRNPGREPLVLSAMSRAKER